MALSYKARRRWALIILLVALPLYIVIAVNLTDWLRASYPELPFWGELLVFVGLGFLWILPLKSVFKGVGQPDPDTRDERNP